MTETEERQASALEYATRGWLVFPLRGKVPLGNCEACRDGNCVGDCGHDLCHGVLAASSDPAVTRRRWQQHPGANIGARVPSGLFVIDIDPRSEGDASLAALTREHGLLPATLTALSGRGDGGAHFYFVHPGGALTSRRLPRGIDLKTHSGYTVVPPSVHPDTGRPYVWARQVAPVKPPAWLVSLLREPPAPPRPPRPRGGLGASFNGPSIADAYAEQSTWSDLLGPEGWRCIRGDGDSDGSRWRHPDASNGHSASVRHGQLFVYTSGTPFEPTEAGSPHGYTKFRAYAVLRHGGNLSEAARSLRAEVSR